jgi:hypothetical protein
MNARFMVALVFYSFWAAGGSASTVEPDSAASQSDGHGVWNFLVEHLGESLAKQSVVRLESGQLNSNDISTGYYETYRFTPPSMPSEHALFGIQTDLAGNYEVMYEGQFPDCVTSPELCDVAISSSAAVEIAKSGGLATGANGYTVKLVIAEGVAGFVWYVAPRDESVHLFTGPTVLINAHSGDIEKRTSGFN